MQQRKQFDFTASAAAEIEVNTNFVLPTRGSSKIVSRVNNYRKIQRDSTQLALIQNSQRSELQEPPPLKAPKLSEIQSQTCKNFLFSDATRVNSYENLQQSFQNGASSNHAESPRDKTRQTTRNVTKMAKTGRSANHQVLQRSMGSFNAHRGAGLAGEHSLNKYASAVKQASRQLRNNLVNNYQKALQTTIQTAHGNQHDLQKAAESMIRPVSQSRLNQALRMSVSSTHHHVKSAVAADRRSLNLNSIQNPLETPRLLFQQPNVTSAAINTGSELLPPLMLAGVNQPSSGQVCLSGRSAEKASLELLMLNSARGNTQRINSKNGLYNPNTPNTGSTPLKLDTDFLRSQQLPPRKSQNSTTMPGGTTQEATLNRPTVRSNTNEEPTEQERTQRSAVTQRVSYKQISPSEIKKMGPYEIYIPKSFTAPSLEMTQQDLMMNRFVSFIQKGYLKQAETALACCDHQSPVYQFNSGLLKLLQKKPQEAQTVLLEYHSESTNAILAQKQLDSMKVTHNCNPLSGINESYFKRGKPFPTIHKTPKPAKDPKQSATKSKPSEWDFFLLQVKKYRADELARFIEDKKYFDKVLQRMNHIADGSKTLIPNVLTKIISEPGVDSRDTDKIIQVTNERSSELTDAPNMAADKSLEEVFIELINIQSTYCVGAHMDPIIESYNDLIEGLRTFNEKFEVEKFVNDFLTQANKHNVQAIQDLQNRYNVPDAEFLRARTFIMSCFDMEDPDSHDIALNFLLEIVRQAEEVKLKRFMDPDRFAIENIFNHLLQDIQTASRNENGPGPLSDDDQHWIDRLSFHKDLSGRSLENFLSRILCVSKQELNQYNAASKFIERPENFDRIEVGRCPKSIRVEIQRKVEKAWQDHIKKPLSADEQQEVLQGVADEVVQIETEARQRVEANREYQMNVEAERVKEESHKNLLFFEAKPVKKRIPMRLKLSNHIKMKVFRETAKIVQKRKKEAERDLLLNEDDDVAEQDQESEPDSEDKESQNEKFVFQAEHMLIEGQPKQIVNFSVDLWSDHPKADKLRKTLFDIQLMCSDEKIIFNRDKLRLAPLLEKWGVEAEVEKEEFDKIHPLEQTALKVDRPKIGQEVPQKIMKFLIKNLKDINSLFQSELTKLDQVLVEQFRFFSIIDKNVRLAIYKSCDLVHYQKAQTLVEHDVDETEFVYVVLQGRVDYMMYKFETRTTVVAATYRAGEVFGDASIQRQFFDVLKCLSKDRNYLQTACSDVYTLRIPKDAFISAIFAEMRVELMFKILLFRKTPYFQELSPYSLIMFASICEVKDYKYGEIIVPQGEKPTACYLVAHGRCQSIYQYVEEQSTEVSKYARKVLRSGMMPSRGFQSGNLDYAKLPLQLASEAHQQQAQERSPLPQKKPLKQSYSKAPAFQEEPGSPNDEDSNVANSPLQVKRAYYHGVLAQDDLKKRMQYENHILFEDVTPGKVFGVRTLLDYTTFNKQIHSNSIRFSEQLGINQEEYADQFKQQRKQQESRDRVMEQRRQQLIENAVIESKEEFQCLSDEQPHHTLSKSHSLKGFSDAIEISQIKNSIDQNTSIDNETANNDQSQNEWGSTSQLPSKHAMKESLDDICQRQFIDHMHDSLMRSQTSIQVMSATAKLIVIRREDKTFLNEALKQSIDRVILDQDFKDFDRPLNNFKEVQKSVEQTRTWIQFKKKTEQVILREAQQQRQQNSKM